MRGAREGLALYGLGIAAGTAIECPGNPADGSDADPRALVDVAVRHALEQQRHHPPAIGHGLEFGRRAQVLEERSHVLCPVERSQRLRQGLHGGLDIAFRQGFWALFHPHSMYLRINTISQTIALVNYYCCSSPCIPARGCWDS